MKVTREQIKKLIENKINYLDNEISELEAEKERCKYADIEYLYKNQEKCLEHYEEVQKLAEESE